jgi:5-methylthioadenosine/S-adenosylhomocysteine deaminase
MFREMGLVSLIHKGLQRSSTAAPADQVVRMATVNAARALKRSGELGEISDGAKADLVFVDLTEPSMFPANNIMSSLCYSANGSEVKSVMIGGKFVMRNREFATIDAERVRYEVQKMVDTYL